VSEPRAYVEVDLRAISSNIKHVGSLSDAKILAVVKADAYGHGLIEVAETAVESGAEWLGTALLEEALALRTAGLKVPILAWLTPPGEDFDEALRQNIDLSVSSLVLLDEVLSASERTGIKPRIHIEVDTGMTRGGFLEEWDPFLIRINEVKDSLHIVGFWTHFARADEPESDFTEQQLILFNVLLNALQSQGIYPEIIHAANSAGALAHPGSHKQMVRLGIAMYGLSPDVSTMGSSEKLGLKPAMSIKAKLVNVKSVPALSRVGYGGVGVTDRDTKLGIVCMGYSDGLPRRADSTAGVSYNGELARLVGRVSMDQCVVDLGPDSTATAGEYVTVIGEDGFSADDWAQAAGTINYEITTRIATRLPRIYQR
jgi:alanine racemase